MLTFIMEVMQNKYYIKEGLSISFRNNKWQIEGNNGIYDDSDKRFILFLLPVLEMNYTKFILSVATRQEVNCFPFPELIKFPFENRMNYWAGLALIWLNERNENFGLDEWSKEIDLSWMSQGLKHKYVKVFKKTA